MKNVPYRHFALSLSPRDCVFFCLEYGKISPPEEGKYGKIEFPDNLSVLIDSDFWGDFKVFFWEWVSFGKDREAFNFSFGDFTVFRTDSGRVRIETKAGNVYLSSSPAVTIYCEILAGRNLERIPKKWLGNFRVKKD